MALSQQFLIDIDRSTQDDERSNGLSLCDWGPDAIIFLRGLVDKLPIWNVWTRPIAKAGLGLLEKLLERRCGISI